MLKLHQLEISGFKSFVDPVELRFAGGITAIVGPNGCGKSNLSDAITWVLGEQSAKSLRSTKMEDVIFAGSENRKPVGMAEVSLTLVTDSSFRDAVDGKIRIGRRVFRTGESQYRLNGKVRRLKEIKDLLMDTGLGIRAYSVIEQGKIGMILSGKPQERRRLLEEAAGITRYRARKRVAEVKLEEAVANLLRLDDVISEVERALRSLKRQANAARRYQEKDGEYRSLLRQVLLGRWSRLRERLRDLDERLEELTDRDAELAATLYRDEAALAAGREDLDTLSRELGERHQQQAALAATIEGRQEFLRGARQRLTEVDERIVRGKEQAADRQEQTLETQGFLGDLDGRTVELIAEHDAAARVVADDETRIAAAQQAVAEAEARLEALRRELMESLARNNQLRSELQHEQVEIEKRSYRQRFLAEEQARLDRQLEETEAALAAIDEKIGSATTRLDERVDERQRLSETLDALLRREAELSNEQRHLESRLAAERQRQQILVELSEQHAERRRSLIETLGVIGVAEPHFLADEVEPIEGWEGAIDHFLGELADAVLVDADSDGLELARALSRLNSSGTFLKPRSAGRSPAEVEDPAICYSLAEALRLAPELASALPPAYLVTDAEDAERLAGEHPGIAFICRDRLWALGGALRVQGEEAAPGVLARESELESIRLEIPENEERLRQATETLKRLVDERTRHASAIHRLDDEIAELRREIAVAQARRQDAAARNEKHVAEHQEVAREQDKIGRELGTKAATKEQLAIELREADAGHQGLTESFDRCQLEVNAAREERETLRTAGAGRRARLELLKERLESQNKELTRLRHQIEEASRQMESWGQERETLDRRRRELEIAMEEAEAELQAALESRAAAQEAVLAQQERLDQRREELRLLEGQVQEARVSSDELRGQIEELRVARAGVRQDAEHLGATYREEFRRILPGMPTPVAEEQVVAAADETADGAEMEPEAVAADEADDEIAEADVARDDVEEENGEYVQESAAEAVVEEEADIPLMDRAQLAELEADLARCKAILERLGPVNVLAAKEYEEQEERGSFLTEQRGDVARSVESLKTTIQEINEISSERFLTTFEEVNRAFGETFHQLFRGGEAEMSLLDEEDILETGIEIIARPPGKRSQNIMLLSGGEKALAAIALLFALFRTKPSPFCILDEVDAPLDDANVLRFVDTLKEMARETQFLIVTHNKLTMEVASTLYGVTMEERGISKTVSVELEDLHRDEQTAAVA
ncbi:MAG: chromosome segregation protein SMC [bacterium]|nr:chromosome segregation protein SMC [bacterium]